MPVRVKTENAVTRTWARRDSRDSLSSTDHLIAVYSLESKDPSECYEAPTATATATATAKATATAAMEAMSIHLKQSSTTSTNDSPTGTKTRASADSLSSASWVKTPWAVCFPPHLQASRNTKSPTRSTSTGRTSTNKHKQPRSQRSSSLSSFSVTCGGYDFEEEQKQEEDARNRSTTGNTRVNVNLLHIEQSEDVTPAFSNDDDSVTSWTSQNAVKFNKKLKPKVADAHCRSAAPTATTNRKGATATELVVPASFWDAWAGNNKSSDPTSTRTATKSKTTSTSTAPPARVLAKKSHRKESSKHTTGTDITPPPTNSEASISVSSPEKRDENNEAGSAVDHLSPNARQVQEEFSDDHHGGPVSAEAKVIYNDVHNGSTVGASASGDDSSSVVNTAVVTKKKPQQPVVVVVKKSVRFTNPLVTSQHFRPRTRPEDVSMLFFDEDELEILEEDRETTSRDQFEMIAQELSENRLRISIAYQNRWRDHRRRHSSASTTITSTGVQVSMSASDV